MQILDHYPLVTTSQPQACAEFYQRFFGFETVFSSCWFVMVQRPAETGHAITLAFMSADHPSMPSGPEFFNGRGLLLTLQVADAMAAQAELRAAGVTISYEARREPWGQIRFQCLDPAGLALDICEQVEPAAGFWDPFMQSDAG